MKMDGEKAEYTQGEKLDIDDENYHVKVVDKEKNEIWAAQEGRNHRVKSEVQPDHDKKNAEEVP